MDEPFKLRDISEQPLISADIYFSEFSQSVKAKVLSNYRDFPSRTIFWKKGRTVYFIQIILDANASTFENSNILFNVYACSYKIKLPVLTFWNMRFDISNNKCEKIHVLQAPIQKSDLFKTLDDAYQKLNMPS